jgi:type IV pilus assembly protein PilO
MAISNFRFENLPRSMQILIIAAIVGILAVLFYIYYLKDLVQKQNQLEAEIHKLEISVAQATAIEGQLNSFKQELAQLEEYLDRLRSILPAQKETPTVLRSVQQMAASSELKILKFIPQPIINRDFYSDWPITIEVEGNYNGLGTFFDKVGKATRLINVDGISVRGVENSMDNARTLSASCTATTFVFREEQAPEPETNTPVKPVKKGKRR